MMCVDKPMEMFIFRQNLDKYNKIYILFNIRSQSSNLINEFDNCHYVTDSAKLFDLKYTLIMNRYECHRLKRQCRWRG